MPGGGALAAVVVLETRRLRWTKWYYYNDDGNVTRVVTKTENPPVGTPPYSATWLEYAVNQRTVVYAIGERWNAAGYAITYAREFRYDGARARYMDRELDSTKRTVKNQVTRDEATEVVRQTWRVGWPIVVSTTSNPTGVKDAEGKDIKLIELADADRGWVALSLRKF